VSSNKLAHNVSRICCVWGFDFVELPAVGYLRWTRKKRSVETASLSHDSKTNKKCWTNQTHHCPNGI